MDIQGTMSEVTEGPAAPKPAKKVQGFGLRRRQVLAGAGVAAGGLALTRLMGLHHLGPDITLPGQPPPTGSPLVSTGTRDWVSPLNKPEAQIAHLLRRATFGATSAQYQQAVKDGFKTTVDKLIETKIAEPQPLPGGEEASKSKPINPSALQQWWINWMLTSPTPFGERMTFFWHGHFTSDYRKVTTQSPYIYWQNLTWRRMALGGLRDMLVQVTIDPGMLRYLDLGTSTGKSPNENYSRELMELFSMGVGNFTEEDVRGGAKALSGWREPLTQQMAQDLVNTAIEKTGAPPKRTPTPDTVKVGVFDQTRAYQGAVTFLGQTRQWDTQSVLDKIIAQDAVAPFIVNKVLSEFVTPGPEATYVKRLADAFRKSKYDLKTLMRDVFTSPEFLAPANYRALVKSPTELMVHIGRALEAPQITKSIAVSGGGMGQALFDPPEVGGWPSNASWISSNDVLQRINFAVNTLTSLPKIPPFKDAHVVHVDGVVSDETAQLLNSATDDATRWLILLASPEFQLK